MLNLSFDFLTPEVFGEFILGGLLFSLKLTLIAALGGLLFGTALALMRLSRFRVLQSMAAIYVNGMRSIPLVMVILWFYLLMPFVIGKPIGAELSAIITFTAFEAAFFCEIVRAGIQAIPPGQTFAAQALGLTYGQSMRYILLPQALRAMIPVLLSQTIILFQDTSLVYAIGAYDLLKGLSNAGKIYGRTEEAYVLAAISYFLLCFSLSWAVRRVQQRLAIPR